MCYWDNSGELSATTALLLLWRILEGRDVAWKLQNVFEPVQPMIRACTGRGLCDWISKTAVWYQKTFDLLQIRLLMNTPAVEGGHKTFFSSHLCKTLFGWQSESRATWFIPGVMVDIFGMSCCQQNIFDTIFLWTICIFHPEDFTLPSYLCHVWKTDFICFYIKVVKS
jgi:hypothetical protein